MTVSRSIHFPEPRFLHMYNRDVVQGVQIKNTSFARLSCKIHINEMCLDVCFLQNRYSINPILLVLYVELCHHHECDE